MPKHPKPPEKGFETMVLRRLAEIECKLDKLISLTWWCCCKVPTGVQIIQLDKGEGMKKGNVKSITGINVGSTGTFEADPTPTGTSFPAGTVDTWTASDPSITITPHDPSDPEDASVDVGVPAGSTLTQFDLTVSAQMPPGPDGTVPPPLTDTETIPVIAAPVPLPTGVVINQVA